MRNVTGNRNDPGVISESINSNRGLAIFNGLQSASIFFQGASPILGASLRAKVEAQQFGSGGHFKILPFRDIFAEPLDDAILHLH